MIIFLKNSFGSCTAKRGAGTHRIIIQWNFKAYLFINECSKVFFYILFPLLSCHYHTSQMSNFLKKVKLSLNRTNPPELKGIVREFKPLTHLCLTSKIPHTQDGRSALAETNPPSLSVQTWGREQLQASRRLCSVK